MISTELNTFSNNSIYTIVQEPDTGLRTCNGAVKGDARHGHALVNLVPIPKEGVLIGVPKATDARLISLSSRFESDKIEREVKLYYSCLTIAEAGGKRLER